MMFSAFKGPGKGSIEVMIRKKSRIIAIGVTLLVMVLVFTFVTALKPTPSKLVGEWQLNSRGSHLDNFRFEPDGTVTAGKLAEMNAFDLRIFPGAMHEQVAPVLARVQLGLNGRWHLDNYLLRIDWENAIMADGFKTQGGEPSYEQDIPVVIVRDHLIMFNASNTGRPLILHRVDGTQRRLAY